jgi:hypothetical protein
MVNRVIEFWLHNPQPSTFHILLSGPDRTSCTEGLLKEFSFFGGSHCNVSFYGSFQHLLKILRQVKFFLTQELANEAGVSLGQVANVKKLLLDREWVAQQNGFPLTEPWKLLEDWSNAYTYRKNEVRNFYSLKSIPEIEADLARVCSEKGIEYALTGFSGAARFAPAVRYSRAMAYVSTMPEDMVSSLILKEVESGANVMLLEPYDEGVFYGTQVIDDIRIASPLQIYLDLKGYKGRGEEAAEALLRDVIKPNWSREKR